MQRHREPKPKKCKVTKSQHDFVKSADPRYEMCRHCGEPKVKNT